MPRIQFFHGLTLALTIGGCSSAIAPGPLDASAVGPDAASPTDVPVTDTVAIDLATFNDTTSGTDAVVAMDSASAPDLPTIVDIPAAVDIGTATDTGPPSPISAGCERCAMGCSDAIACFEDPTCNPCITVNDRAPACATNALFLGTVTCACSTCASDCATECSVLHVTADAGHDAGSPADAGLGTCLTCVEGTCPAQGAACLGDTTCTGCITSGSFTSATCLGNAAFRNLALCACTGCTSACGAVCPGG